MNDKVTEYIEKQILPHKAICQKLREIILSTFPNIREEMKFGVPYYEDKYYIVALKTHVNLGFSIKNLTKNDIDLFEGSGKMTRHIKINSLEDIEEKNIIKLLKIVK
ncbi:MAG: DUF1801 domain-containing protein [Promethearchaeota archaeon]